MTDAAALAALKSAACAAVDRHGDALLEVSHDLHAHPELAFAEHYAAERLCTALAEGGLAARRGAYGLETAFDAGFGNSGPTVALLAEYDALPGIGHACGHNLIATAALGATLALHALGPDLGPGRIRLIGTPAEEKGGGKEIMARNGAFEGVDAAMMIHPSGVNLATMPCLCIAEVKAEYHGRSAHASAMPHRGINALDGLLLAYQAISNLRQHIRPSERIHGIVTHGGQAPNIVPDFAAGEFYVRAANLTHLAALKQRVQDCFEAGARGTGCEVKVRWSDVDYFDLRTNWPIADAFRANAEALGREFLPMERLGAGSAGSTDMGNVSYRVPSIHPMLAAAPADVVIHHPDFARWARSEMGDRAALDGARALAMTAIDFLARADLRSAAQKAFEIARGLA